MAYATVRHRVKDFDTFKAAFEGGAEMRKSGGEQSFQIFRQADDPNMVFGVFAWDSIENARKFMSAPELADAMKQAGVASAPEIVFYEEAFGGAL